MILNELIKTLIACFGYGHAQKLNPFKDRRGDKDISPLAFKIIFKARDFSLQGLSGLNKDLG